MSYYIIVLFVLAFDNLNLLIKFLNLLLSLPHFLAQLLNLINLILNCILCSLQLCSQLKDRLLFLLKLLCLTFEFAFHLRQLFGKFLFLTLQHKHLLHASCPLSRYITFDLFVVSRLQHELLLFLLQVCLLNWDLVYLLLETCDGKADLTHFVVQLLELRRLVQSELRV